MPVDQLNLVEKIAPLTENLSRVIQGKGAVIESVIVALLAHGHILLEDVPGVGKTTLAKGLASSVNAEFQRIQFTPDLLPSDISGSDIFIPGKGEIVFKEGPLFANIILADEINRASPRTQSALLEAMSEGQVTNNGVQRKLPDLFLVIATQNPVEYQGTYPLPEAQLDRFCMQLSLNYPSATSELDMLLNHRHKSPLSGLGSVLHAEDILELQKQVKEIEVEKSLASYIIEIVRATREHPLLKMGASPRASLTLYRCSQALAALRGRTSVLPDDIKALAESVLAHRLVMQRKQSAQTDEKKGIIAEILQKIPVPL